MAAAQMKKELEEKENVAEAKRMELLRQAGIEHLRLQFGKKPTPTCKSLQEKVARACKCAKTMAAGYHK